jgi:hypothetical protein
MSEGLFLPSNLAIPGLSVDRLTAAVVRIHPKTILVLDVVSTESEARERTRNEARADGSECWHCFLMSEDVAKANDPEFAMGMVRHEFSELVRTGAKGQSRLAEDTAVLRIEPAPIAHLQRSPRSPKIGESIWMSGFPLRTARSEQSLNVIGYSDADGSLRVSTGCVTEVDENGYFASDADGSMGNSGSPVFDASGLVMGMFSRTTGDGPRNAFEYGHVGRIQVPSKLATSGMGMNTAVRDDGSPCAQLKR